jgi:type I protein arginine methyltransferase
MVSCFVAPLHGFAFWFEVEFNGPITISSNNNVQFPFQHGNNNGSNHRKRRQNDTIVLSTAPEETPTHWQQVWIPLKK